jgi:hypothetical protein
VPGLFGGGTVAEIKSCCSELMPRLLQFFLTVVLIASAIQARATIDVTLQMQLGNPSGATTDTNNHSHFLLQRSVEAIDYSDSLGTPLWASWDLTAGENYFSSPK